jgi:hypothetical protein
VIKVRNAVKEQIKPLSLDQRLEYLALLTMEIKALKRIISRSVQGKAAKVDLLVFHIKLTSREE